MIESPVSLSVKSGQLIVQTAENAASFPIEDLDAVLIENTQVRWTVSVVSALAENGCAVYICNAKHMPNGILLPYMQHVNLHRMRLKANVPENGSIRMLVVTEKQYESIELLLGKLTVEEESPPTETITLF